MSDIIKINEDVELLDNKANVCAVTSSDTLKNNINNVIICEKDYYTVLTDISNLKDYLNQILNYIDDKLVNIKSELSSNNNDNNSNVISNLVSNYNTLFTIYTDLSTKYNNLLIKYDNLVVNNNNLLTKYSDLLINNNDLSTKYNDLFTKYSEFTNSYLDLKTKYESLITFLNNNIARIDTFLSALTTDFDNYTSMLTQLQTAFVNATATITSLQTTIATETEAIAQSLTTLSASLNGHTASITELQSASVQLRDGVATALARASLIVNADGAIGGYEITADGATQQSEFKVLADSFKITDGAQTITPFSIQNGIVYIGDNKFGTTATKYLGSFASEPDNMTNPINSIYFNTTDGNSYILDEYRNWVLLSRKGDDGHTPLLGIDYFVDGSSYQATIFKEVPNGTNPGNVPTPTGATFNGTVLSNLDGWSDDPIVTDTTNKFLVISTATFKQDPSTGVWSIQENWSVPAKYTIEKGVDFFDGVEGVYNSFIYKEQSTMPNTPSGGSYDGTTEVIPTGWTDNPPYNPTDIVWISSAKYKATRNADGTVTWQSNGWSAPSKFYEKGKDGAPGAPGARGAGFFTAAVSSAGWSDLDADNAIASMGYTKVLGDRVTLYYTSGNWSETRHWNGSYWVSSALVVTGNMLVTGGITASKISAGHIGTAISASSGFNWDSSMPYGSTDEVTLNSPTVVSLVYNNITDTSVKVLINIVGHVWFPGNYVDYPAETRHALFQDSTKIFDSSWISVSNFNRVFTVVTTIPAYSSPTFSLKAVGKVSDDYDTMSLDATISIIGISSGS